MKLVQFNPENTEHLNTTPSIEPTPSNGAGIDTVGNDGWVHVRGEANNNFAYTLGVFVSLDGFTFPSFPMETLESASGDPVEAEYFIPAAARVAVRLTAATLGSGDEVTRSTATR